MSSSLTGAFGTSYFNPDNVGMATLGTISPNPASSSQYSAINYSPGSLTALEAATSTQSVLMLGGVVFKGFEIPERIGPFGGRQITAVHEFVGGTRQVHPLGPQSNQVRWSGTLFGGDLTYGARARSITLDTLRKNGKLVTLTWSIYSMQVIISEFNPEPESEWVIPYSIVCDVQVDQTAQLAPSAPDGDAIWDQTISQLYANATLAATNYQTAQNQAIASAVATDVLVVNALRTSTLALMQAVDVQYGITTFLSDISKLNTIGNGNIFSDAASAIVLATQLTTAVNLLNGNTGSILNTIPVINPNLFEISTLTYGSPIYWQQIAQQNGLPNRPLQTGVFNNLIISPQTGGSQP